MKLDDTMNEGVLRTPSPRDITRRWFFKDCGAGLGSAALYSLIQGEQARAATVSTNALASRASHFAPKAKRVIYLFMAGARWHLELFDDKPELAKWTFRFQGRDFRLTDVHGNIVTKLLA